MNCPYCRQYFPKKALAVAHLEKMHADQLETEGLDPSQKLYLMTHTSLHGKCMCGCDTPTEWNYRTGKPYKVSPDPKCRERIYQIAQARSVKATGHDQHTLMNDVERQTKMLHNRKITSQYKFPDGGIIDYTGKLELAQLRNQLANERRAHRSSLDSKRLALNIFEKDVSQMQQTLDDAHIKSPRRGTLTFIDNQLGRQVTVGEKVAVISDLTRFKVSGEIAESMGDRVSVGSGVIVRLGSTSLQGTVSNLTPKSTDGSVSFTVKLDDDDNPRLRAGQKVQIFVLYEVMDNVVRIANGSYYKGPGDYELFVQTADNELTRRKVKIGAGNYDYVEVMSGISPGENVVVSDMTTYQKNNKLKIK